MQTKRTGTPAGRGNGHVHADWSSMPEWITVDEAAQLSDFHPEYVRRLARRGKIGAEKKGRDWWIDRDIFRAYLENMEAMGEQKFTRLDFREEGEPAR